MPEPREYTEDEIREKFLKNCVQIKKYWLELPNKTTEERMSGMLFSLLVSLDGGSMAVPGWILAPCPHEDDKEFHKSNGENYYPENHDKGVTGDIAGCLHELLGKFDS